MSVVGATLILVAAVLTAVSNILLRIGVVRAGELDFSKSFFSDLWRLCPEPAFTLGILLYGLAALVWIGIVSTEDLATGYVLLVSAAFIAVTLGAHFVVREPMTLQRDGCDRRRHPDCRALVTKVRWRH